MTIKRYEDTENCVSFSLVCDECYSESYKVKNSIELKKFDYDHYTIEKKNPNLGIDLCKSCQSKVTASKINLLIALREEKVQKTIQAIFEKQISKTPLIYLEKNVPDTIVIDGPKIPPLRIDWGPPPASFYKKLDIKDFII